MHCLTILFAMLGECTSGYPIPPIGLRELYRSADLVVVAKAGKTESLSEKLDSWFSAKVTLTVEKSLKGKATDGKVTVYFAQGLVCPAPDRYPEDRTQLVFLKWRKEIQGYHARGLSYATKELAPRALEVYLLRLEELSKIPAEKRDEAPSPATLDWLVRCIEGPATRWEGAMEFQSWGSEKDPLFKAPSPAQLSKAQRGRIVDALNGTAEFGRDEIYAVDIFKEIPDSRMDTYLATELRAQYARRRFYCTATLMTMVSERLKLEGGEKLISEFNLADAAAGMIKALGKFLDLVEQK